MGERSVHFHYTLLTQEQGHLTDAFLHVIFSQFVRISAYEHLDTLEQLFGRMMRESTAYDDRIVQAIKRIRCKWDRLCTRKTDSTHRRTNPNKWRVLCRCSGASGTLPVPDRCAPGTGSIYADGSSAPSPAGGDGPQRRRQPRSNRKPRGGGGAGGQQSEVAAAQQ